MFNRHHYLHPKMDYKSSSGCEDALNAVAKELGFSTQSEYLDALATQRQHILKRLNR